MYTLTLLLTLSCISTPCPAEPGSSWTPYRPAENSTLQVVKDPDAFAKHFVPDSDKVIWSKPISTGEKNMSHHVANLEYHHFKYEAHRVPGDAHVYFFGADAFSYGDGLTLEAGDIMVVDWEGFGRPLRNPIRILEGEETFVSAEPM